MDIYIIENAECTNCIISTLDRAAQFYPDAELIERTPNCGFDIGWTRIDGVWTPPEEPSWQ